MSEGWHCIGVEDLLDQREICELCNKTEIRYVHTLRHHAGKEIRVGCICAGILENNPVGAKSREDKFKRLKKSKARFITKRWKISEKGNEYLVTKHGFTIGVKKHGRYFSGWFGNKFLPSNFRSASDVKAALFDLLQQKP